MRWLPIGAGFSLVALLAGCNGVPDVKTPIDLSKICELCPNATPPPCPPEKVCPPEKECPPEKVCPPEQTCPPPPPCTASCQMVDCPAGFHCEAQGDNKVACVADAPPPPPPPPANCSTTTCEAGHHCEMHGEPLAPVCVADAPPPPEQAKNCWAPPGTPCSAWPPDTTGFNLHHCKDSKGKEVCGLCQYKPWYVKNTDGIGGTYHLPVGTTCDSDSTPRHKWIQWKLPCDSCGPKKDKPCIAPRLEYPPKPAVGWDCNGGPTTWKATGGITLLPADDFGRKVKINGEGVIEVCRGDGTHCLSKPVKNTPGPPGPGSSPKPKK